MHKIAREAAGNFWLHRSEVELAQWGMDDCLEPPQAGYFWAAQTVNRDTELLFQSEADASPRSRTRDE